MERCCNGQLAPEARHVLLRRSLQSLHLLLTRLCAHMPEPPQSRQWRLSRLCGQMLVPPQSLQVLLRRLCWSCAPAVLAVAAVMLAE